MNKWVGDWRMRRYWISNTANIESFSPPWSNLFRQSALWPALGVQGLKPHHSAGRSPGRERQTFSDWIQATLQFDADPDLVRFVASICFPLFWILYQRSLRVSWISPHLQHGMLNLVEPVVLWYRDQICAKAWRSWQLSQTCHAWHHSLPFLAPCFSSCPQL